ncbi:hypothetical protein L227DRAFT_150820 [Lentinus tigrinus ALCF2SS1-6]|uniref:Uncharacterized protein n=1 Tax=Lentinus tigrinus ALCF2SS1-6 TaxID=1328759 RepID=A0A5C2STC8_9APHY|nr:hypothetical protein L227DRAFT_150820 [Lentinus tigrinus ALCF2SS1-6]
MYGATQSAKHHLLWRRRRRPSNNTCSLGRLLADRPQRGSPDSLRVQRSVIAITILQMLPVGCHGGKKAEACVTARASQYRIRCALLPASGGCEEPLSRSVAVAGNSCELAIGVQL